MRFTCALVLVAGFAFGQLSPIDQRIADLTELIERKPDFASAYFARGVSHLSASQYDLAEADLSKAIELRPDAASYSSRAQVYAATNKIDLEIADLTRAIDLKPGNAAYYLRRADGYRGKNDLQPAISDYTEAIRIAPSVAAYRGRSASRKQLGDTSGAAEDDRMIEQMEATRNAPRPAIPSPANPAPRTAPPGDPLSHTGAGGGIGSGAGTGVGTQPKTFTPPRTTSPLSAYRIGGGVSQPAIIFKVEPEYSEEARKAKWQGTVTLSIVVDQFGEAQNITVQKSLGLGLDQEAIEAVQKWVFKPGRKDGQPVAVFATIQVTFHLL